MESLNPATGEPLAKIKLAGPADYECVMARAAEAFLDWRMMPAPQARRNRARNRQRTARTQGRPGRAGDARNGQDPARRAGRGAGDDRHRRFRRGPLAPALRPHHAQRAARPSHVRAVAPAGDRGRHQRVQFPGGRVVVERHDRGGVRRLRAVAAVFGDAAHRHRRAENLQPRARPPRPEGRLQPGDRTEPAHRRDADPRPPHPAGQLHRLDRRRAARFGGGGPAAGPQRFSNWAATTASS